MNKLCANTQQIIKADTYTHTHTIALEINRENRRQHKKKRNTASTHGKTNKKDKVDR